MKLTKNLHGNMAESEDADNDKRRKKTSNRTAWKNK